MLKKTILNCFLLFTFLGSQSQDKVAVVLSGGGATALAHIGVLKALEENNIPIDYIAGTSMGAVVGGLYASGYSVEQIITWIQLGYFERIKDPVASHFQPYLFSADAPNASLLEFDIDPQKPLEKNLPTNFSNSAVLDFELMRFFANVSLDCKNNFDSLMIPFFAVSADVNQKKARIFRSGYLPDVIRSSVAFPFYYTPQKIEGVYYFDGGIYNNFPVFEADSLFQPTIIIGSDLSETEEMNSEEDLVSQIRGLILNRKAGPKPRAQLIHIQPQTTVGTFEFERAMEAVEAGYQACLKQIPEIQKHIKDQRSPGQVAKRRQNFRKNITNYKFRKINSETPGFKKSIRTPYIQSKHQRKNKIFNIYEARKWYGRALQDPLIESAYPVASIDSTLPGYHTFDLKLKKSAPLHVSIGGLFSSSPISSGFLQIDYKKSGILSNILSANSYFGKFYSSVGISNRFTFSLKRPWKLEAAAYFNNLDYFKSRANFFNPEVPSFIILQNGLGLIQLSTPSGESGEWIWMNRYLDMNASFYDNKAFTNEDTPDLTRIFAYSSGFKYRYSTLNRKQFATEGSEIEVTVKVNTGVGTTTAGSTSLQQIDFRLSREWSQAKLKAQHFFQLGGASIGPYLELNWNNQPEFTSISGTQIFSDHFSPIPESQTLFNTAFRANEFIGTGVKHSFPIFRNLEWYSHAFLFFSWQKLELTASGGPEWVGTSLQKDYLLATGLLFQGPLGPISLFWNKYGEQNTPFLSLNLGYILFNPRTLE